MVILMVVPDCFHAVTFCRSIGQVTGRFALLELLLYSRQVSISSWLVQALLVVSMPELGEGHLLVLVAEESPV